MIHEQPACASLPQVNISIRATLCQHHQAWTLAVHTYAESGGADTLDVVPYTEVEFGPFDHANDVRHAAESQLAAALVAAVLHAARA